MKKAYGNNIGRISKKGVPKILGAVDQKTIKGRVLDFCNVPGRMTKVSGQRVAKIADKSIFLKRHNLALKNVF